MPIKSFHTTIRGNVHNPDKTDNSKEEQKYVLIKTKNIQQNIPYIPQIYDKIAPTSKLQLSYLQFPNT